MSRLTSNGAITATSPFTIETSTTVQVPVTTTVLLRGTTTVVSTSPSEADDPFPPSDTASVVSSSPTPGNQSSSQEPGPASNVGVSSAATAGIAIGCIVAGIAIGAFAAFLFFRQKSRGNNTTELVYMPASTSTRDRYYDSKLTTEASTAAPSPTAGPADDGDGGVQLDQLLLAPVPDKNIVSELSALGHLIQHHVESSYHCHPLKTTPQNPLAQTLIEIGLGSDAAMAPGQMVSLALNPSTRCAMLQHVIARAVLGSVVLSANTSRFSLLPASMSAFMKDMAPTERHGGSPEAVSAAFTKWRQLSAFLMHPERSSRSPLLPRESMVGDKVQELVATLNSFLGPFVDESTGLQQERNLYDVVMECARFGYMLISQPGEFRLRYDAGRQRSNSDSGGGGGGIVMVVCPGLDKISDDRGRRYSPPRTLLAPACSLTAS